MARRSPTPNNNTKATDPKTNGDTSNGSARKRKSKALNGHSPEMMSPTQRASRTLRHSQDGDEEVRMGLLGRSTHANGNGVHHQNGDAYDGDTLFQGEKDGRSVPLSKKDKYAVTLLIILYLIQGIPIGLAFGSIPFLLKSRLSYSQLGTFSLATFPYSLKLLHAPVVDAIFHPKLGRRKSWIVPIQIILGSMMIWLGNNAPQLIEVPHPDVNHLTVLFTTLIFFAATQDIAVDGWALELLSQENLSYASTAQTAGLNTGYFLSFTVFLALNSPDFANKYLRSSPLDAPFLSLATYLKFWGFACYAVTFWLLVFKKEDPVKGDADDLHLKRVYKSMWDVCKLKHVQKLIVILLVSKIGFQANEAVTNLKMVEKGLSNEDLALAVLIDFPFQIIGGWLAARWSSGKNSLRPWLWAFWVRLGFAVFSMLLIYIFPNPPIPMSFFVLIIVTNVLSSFSSTIQFVGLSAFFTQIADPVIGGTYMTLLNTISNLGGTWPRFFVLRGVDYFTVAHCEVSKKDTAGSLLTEKLGECVSDAGKALCVDQKGTCVIDQDGYYYISTICVGLGVLILLTYVRPAALKLQALPHSAWRLKQPTP